MMTLRIRIRTRVRCTVVRPVCVTVRAMNSASFAKMMGAGGLNTEQQKQMAQREQFAELAECVGFGPEVDGSCVA